MTETNGARHAGEGDRWRLAADRCLTGSAWRYMHMVRAADRVEGGCGLARAGGGGSGENTSATILWRKVARDAGAAASFVAD